MAKQAAYGSKRRIVLLVLLLSLCLWASSSLSASAAAGEELPAGQTFLDTEARYEALKASIEADEGRNSGDVVDEDIHCVKAALGLGINFGNELDWNYGTNNDYPARQRRYSAHIELGYQGTPYYSCEVPFNALGELFTYANRPDLSQSYAALPLEEQAENTEGLSQNAPVDYLKLSVTNSYNKAWGKAFQLHVKRFSLHAGSRTISPAEGAGTGEDFLGRYSLTFPNVSSDSHEQEVFTLPLDSSYGALKSGETVVHADLQLENFVSDYTGRPGLIYEHSNNKKLIQTGSGENTTLNITALNSLLDFLWAEGIRSIRLPISWYCHMDASGTVDPEWFTEVNKVLRYMINRGFYVIVNIHADTGPKGWIKADRQLFEGYVDAEGEMRPGYKTTYKYLCLQLAENFKNFDGHLILQGPNEVLNYKNYQTGNNKPEGSTGPISDDEYALMNELNQIFVDEVRRTGYNNSRRILLCNTYYSARLNLPKYALPTDSAEDKILVGLHDYTIRDSGLLASIEWLGDRDAEQGGYKYIDPEGDYRYQIVLDEFGVLRTEPLDKRLALMENGVAAAYALGIPLFLWDEGGDYALLEKEKNNGTAGKWEWDAGYDCQQVAAAMIGAQQANQLPLHATETVEAKAATCEEGGSIEYYRCLHCGKIFADAQGTTPLTEDKTKTSPLGHDWGTPEYSWSKDDSEVTAKAVCTRDETHILTETVSSTKEEIHGASCEEAGEIRYSAVFTKEEFSPQSKTVSDSSLGHDYGAWTSIGQSQHQRVCSRNEAHVEKAAHQWEQESVVKASLGKAGKKTLRCRDCGEVRNETIPALSALGKTKIETVGVVSKKIMKTSWTKVKDATGYVVSYKTPAAKNWTVRRTGGSALTLTGMKSKSLYQIKVHPTRAATATTEALAGSHANISYRYFCSMSKLKYKAGKKKVTLRWKKDGKASGYEIRYSTKKSMKDPKTVKVKGSKTKRVIKGLKKGKTYYFCVRPYKKYGGKTYWGISSKVKKIKVK